MEPFRFKNFALKHDCSTQRIGTDSVLLAAVVPLDGVQHVLDVGCGCGVIGFCIADRLLRMGLDGIYVSGVDVDVASIGEAKGNAEAFPAQERCRFDFRHVSLQEFVRNAQSCGAVIPNYDLIVSNPPYFVHSLKPEDARRRLARHGDGSLSYRELVEEAKKLLSPRGSLFVILPQVEGAEFDIIARKSLSPISRIDIQPSPSKEPNRVILGYGKIEKDEVERSKICIRNLENKYTENYHHLTWDFYL